MAQALAEVKKDLGRDAVILHTRTLRVGGVLGVGTKAIIEITASDADPSDLGVKPRPRPRVPTTRLPATIPAPMPASVLDRAEEFIAAAPWEKRATALKTGAPTVKAQAQPEPVAAPIADDGRAPSTKTIEPPSRPVAIDLTDHQVRPLGGGLPTVRVDPSASLSDELSQIKSMLGHVLRSTRSQAIDVGAMPSALLGAYTWLIEQEVPDAIAEALLTEVRDRLDHEELASPQAVRQAVLARIAARISTCDQWPPSRRSGRPSVVALVGPTGVGKTTTLAKLAAGLRLRRGMRVGLVTCDTYRIAAVEQLRTYAEIIGVPLKVALSASELADAITAFGDQDLVLVDTAGRSQNDADRLAELRSLIEVAKPDQTHLVLSSASSPGVLRRACEKFAVLGPDRLLLTKVDEAVGLGPVLDVLERTRLPMSFISTGQEVPDHIERAQPERLARRIMGSAIQPGESANPERDSLAEPHAVAVGHEAGPSR